MRTVLLYSVLLLLGLAGSQTLPGLMGEAYPTFAHWARLITMVCLSFIMIHVGYEFDIDKKNVRKYGWDYFVAATAAAFPWIFCAAYFVFVIVPSAHWGDWNVWKETLLASRFSAPTSAGVLFSMLAAAGLGATWLFKKARILAIFDDLDTVLLMIPLKMMMVGFRWQLAIIVVLMAVQLWAAWKFLHRVAIPITWPFVLLYSGIIVGVAEAAYIGSKVIDPVVPIHIEVLLPAFVLGCMIKRAGAHGEDAQALHQDARPEDASGQRVSAAISALFMFLVGLSMPLIATPGSEAPAAKAPGIIAGALVEHTPAMTWGQIAFHVLLVTLVANLGKMFPALCYRKEASVRERLGVAIGMWPRGEVGAGVLVVSLSYGIGGPIVTIAMLSLALNLVLTGVFILIIKKLIAPVYGSDFGRSRPA